MFRIYHILFTSRIWFKIHKHYTFCSLPGKIYASGKNLSIIMLLKWQFVVCATFCTIFSVRKLSRLVHAVRISAVFGKSSVILWFFIISLTLASVGFCSRTQKMLWRQVPTLSILSSEAFNVIRLPLSPKIHGRTVTVIRGYGFSASGVSSWKDTKLWKNSAKRGMTNIRWFRPPGNATEMTWLSFSITLKISEGLFTQPTQSSLWTFS